MTFYDTSVVVDATKLAKKVRGELCHARADILMLNAILFTDFALLFLFAVSYFIIFCRCRS
jgi:hypothetical protein